MKKYDLESLKDIDISEAFPEDVNSDAYEQAENINKNFGARIDINGMKFYEKPGNKFYGTFYAMGADGKLYATFEFIRGVCYKWNLVRYFGVCQSHIQRFNRNVYKGKKNKINPNGENIKTNQLTQSEESDV